jgi:hypothetical protein
MTAIGLPCCTDAGVQRGVLLAERGGIDPALAAQVMTRSAIGPPMRPGGER